MLLPSIPEHRPARLLLALVSEKTFSRLHLWVGYNHPLVESKGHSFFCTSKGLTIFSDWEVGFYRGKGPLGQGGLQREGELCRLVKDKGVRNYGAEVKQW